MDELAKRIEALQDKKNKAEKERLDATLPLQQEMRKMAIEALELLAEVRNSFVNSDKIQCFNENIPDEFERTYCFGLPKMQQIRVKAIVAETGGKHAALDVIYYDGDDMGPADKKQFSDLGKFYDYIAQYLI